MRNLATAAAFPIINLMARRPKPDPQEELEPQAKLRKPLTPQQAFDTWWPVVARVGGLGLAVVHVLVAQFGPGEIDPAVLTFCGTLVLLSAGGGKKTDG